MSFFKNDNMKKKEATITVDDIKFDAPITNVAAQFDLKDLVKTDVKLADVDNKNDEQKALLAEAIELFSKMLKGYPVSDKVKVWVEKASKEL